VLYVHRLLEPVTLVVQHAFWQYVHQWPRWEGWHRELHADDTCRSKSTKTTARSTEAGNDSHQTVKRLLSSGPNTIRLTILPRRLVVSHGMSWFRLRRKKNDTTRTAIGAALNYATGTATGALTDIGSSPPAAAAQRDLRGE
jgi:hypothetical protein